MACSLVGGVHRISNLNVSGLALEGTLSPYLGTLVTLTQIDVSKNKISGDLPPSLGNLRNTLVFNVDNNQLVGDIDFCGILSTVTRINAINNDFVCYLSCWTENNYLDKLTFDTIGECAAPSGQPTVQPTGQPTGAPSIVPSSVPSGRPSAVPTCAPSTVPTVVPSGRPSAIPTTIPTSSVPTSYPTSRPSAYPTVIPTASPSTLAPTQSRVRDIAIAFRIKIVGINKGVWASQEVSNIQTMKSAVAKSTLNGEIMAQAQDYVQNVVVEDAPVETSERRLRERKLTTVADSAIYMYCSIQASGIRGISNTGVRNAVRETIEDGRFTNFVREYAARNSDSTLSEVSATGFLLETSESSSSQTSADEIDDGTISGIVLGSIFGLGFLVYAAYWYYAKYIANKSLGSRDEEISRRSIELSSRYSKDGSTKNPIFEDIHERRKSRDDLRNSRISILVEGQDPTSIAPWRDSVESEMDTSESYRHSSVADVVGNPMIFNDVIPDASNKRSSALSLDTPKRESTKRTSFLSSIMPSFAVKGSNATEGEQGVIERERGNTSTKIELSQVTGNNKVLSIDRKSMSTPTRTSTTRFSLNTTTAIASTSSAKVAGKVDDIVEEEEEGDNNDKEDGEGDKETKKDLVVVEDAYDEL
jgi:hypothetical protein